MSNEPSVSAADMVARLNAIWRDDDHERGCKGREYECTCGFDQRTEDTAKEAAAFISAQEDAVAWADKTPAAHDVLAERQRQVDTEGWTPDHDDTHADRKLSQAAACYAAPELLSPPTLVPHHWTDDSRHMGDVSQPVGQVEVPAGWPWDGQWWKPSDRRHDLVKAAALLLAEIERLDRAALSERREP